MNEQRAVCELCGEPMPPGEEMFKFHGYSGNCPKPPKPKPPSEMKSTKAMRDRLRELATPARDDFDRAVLCVLDDFEKMTNTH